MIASMTGFGEACAEVEGIGYSVEIRTVNNRYLKIGIRTSDVVSFCEDEIEKRIRSELQRGTVNYSLRVQSTSGKSLYDVDTHAMTEYIGKLQTVAQTSEIEYEINLADLLALPGVIAPARPDTEQAERMKKTVLDLTAQALEKLKAMRREEGRLLVEDLLSNCDVIREKLEQIRELTGRVVSIYHEKLKNRVEELLAGAKLKLDQETLAREVAIFAERSDVAEELTRLDSHLQQFRSSCSDSQNIGRRLDFITQEMLREANTIASKASDAEICRLVIDIKCAIDRIKEQVQNVE